MIDFLESVRAVSPHAEPILVLSLTAIFGLLLGNIKFRGMKLGVAGMLFSGIFFGHLGFRLDPQLMAFLKEFGLVLFVFTVGLQLGPGFFNSLKKDGLKLNALAVLVIALGALIVFGAGSLMRWDTGVLAGIFSGATTNTPSLGAAQQALATAANSGQQANLAAMAYAVAYPFGVIGIILAIILLRVMFRIDPKQELLLLQQEMANGTSEIQRVCFIVENPNLAGQMIRNVPGLANEGVVVSRIRRKDSDQAQAALQETLLQLGDVILTVGPPEQLYRVGLGIGTRVDEDLTKAPGKVTSKRVIVTHKNTVGKTIAATQITQRFGVTVSRVSRQDMILTAMPNMRLQFGDMLNLVGEEAAAFSATGMQWMLLGALVTTVPLVIAGIIGRKFMKLNYLTLSGVLAGSMTDPPALAFANKLAHSDYPSLAYANVYPLTMLLRILVAQVAVLWLI